jgi:hypothetical protein
VELRHRSQRLDSRSLRISCPQLEQRRLLFTGVLQQSGVDRNRAEKAAVNDR